MVLGTIEMFKELVCKQLHSTCVWKGKAGKGRLERESWGEKGAAEPYGGGG